MASCSSASAGIPIFTPRTVNLSRSSARSCRKLLMAPSSCSAMSCGRFRRSGHVPAAGDGNGSGRGVHAIAEWAFGDPAVALVEPAGAGVAGGDGEPGPVVAVRLDQPFRLDEQGGRDAGAAMGGRDVDLLDL